MTRYGTGRSFWLRGGAAALGIGLGLGWIGVSAQPLRAAERISVRFWETERSLPVASLVRFARDGVVEPQLRWYLNRLSPADRQALRNALNQSVPVSAVMVANALSTDLGQHTLQQLVKVLDGSSAVVEPALASALVLAAARQGELRLIDVLEAYPLEALRINAAAVLSLVHQLSGQLNLQNQLYPRLAALGGGPPEPGPDLSSLAAAGDQGFAVEPFAFTGRDGTRIEALAYLPEGKATAPAAPAPLVVLAPGLNTDMNALLYVGQQLASHGYAVAALNFPFTSAHAVKAVLQGGGTIPDPNAWFGQPHSVSDLIDQVQERWGEQVDTRAVGVLGQSLGGYTALALAGASLDWDHLRQACAALADPNQVVLDPAVVWQCQAPGQVVETRSFRDPRVQVAVAVNPVTNPIFSAASMAELPAPVMMVAGTQDLFAPPLPQQLLPYTAVRQPEALLVLQQNGTHLSFLNGDAPLPAFLLGPDRSLARTELQGLVRSFFDRTLRPGTLTPALVAPAQAAVGVEVNLDPLPLLLRPQLSPEQLVELVPSLGARP
ncbi:MAG: alpha/beta hydrolase [Cyanobacteriota bacterium]